MDAVNTGYREYLLRRKHIANNNLGNNYGNFFWCVLSNKSDLTHMLPG